MENSKFPETIFPSFFGQLSATVAKLRRKSLRMGNLGSRGFDRQKNALKEADRSGFKGKGIDVEFCPSQENSLHSQNLLHR